MIAGPPSAANRPLTSAPENPPNPAFRVLVNATSLPVMLTLLMMPVAWIPKPDFFLGFITVPSLPAGAEAGRW
ncbi:hypothetical protein [Proteiniphilum sp.]|uniref:hypothetical protein n=1 Tax=Proteiniphilum sp. TaxID=1926877 RepID=UPI002B2011B7|nr:hypothetical protein [Proteiniphilum sp.]MEA4916027.1 hypothetical protein [Proteiniphilum sp.]